MKLKIGARTFTVRALTDLEYAEDARLGFTDANSGIIALRSKVPADLQAEVLIHETIHAAIFAYGLTFPSQEEPVANTLGAALAQVIRDNPAFVKSIQAAQQDGKAIVR